MHIALQVAIWISLLALYLGGAFITYILSSGLGGDTQPRSLWAAVTWPFWVIFLCFVVLYQVVTERLR